MVVRVNGFLICRSLEEADRVSELVPARLAEARAGDGCLAFEIWRSHADPVRFAVHEQFRDHAAYEAHRERTLQSQWWQITQRIPRDYVQEED